MNQRIQNEQKHGQLIAENAGMVWSWETPAGKLRWQRRVNMLCQDIKSNSKVLELGCGTGYFTKELDKTGASIVAIDISHDLLNKAKALSLKNVDFVEMDAHLLSFENGTFDFVVGSSVLHHLDYHLAIKEIFRVLKPGGLAIFTEPNMLNPQIALQKNIPSLKRKMGDSPDETAFFRFLLKRIFKQYNPVLIQIDYFDFLHPNIPEFLLKIMVPFCLFLERIPLFKKIAGSLYIRVKK